MCGKFPQPGKTSVPLLVVSTTQTAPGQFLHKAGGWICSRTGLTPCLSSQVFNVSKEYCIFVAAFPKVIYHPDIHPCGALTHIAFFILPFGLCILNKFTTFIKDRVNTVQLMVLHQHYQVVDSQHEEDPSL